MDSDFGDQAYMPPRNPMDDAVNELLELNRQLHVIRDDVSRIETRLQESETRIEDRIRSEIVPALKGINDGVSRLVWVAVGAAALLLFWR